MAEKVRFDNFKVFRIIPENKEAIDVLKALEDTLDSFNFWQEPTRPGHYVDVMVPPTLQSQFQDTLAKNKYTSTIFINNVQYLIDRDRSRTRQSTRMGWDDYRTLDKGKV